MEFFRRISKRSSEVEDARLKADMVGMCSAIEKYSSTVHKGHDRKGTSIIKKCPQYQTRCSADGDDFHVIKVAFDLRDSLVNDTTYNVLTSVKDAPLDVIAQNVFVQESENERYAVIGPENLYDLATRIGRAKSTNGKQIVTLYSAFLANEIVECITRYDATKEESPFLRPYRRLIFV
jgi:hypothetical protein